MIAGEDSEMTKLKLDCIEADCGFQAQEVEQDLAPQLLTLHVSTQHTQAVAAGVRLHTTQADRIKRPVLTVLYYIILVNRSKGED